MTETQKQGHRIYNKKYRKSHPEVNRKAVSKCNKLHPEKCNSRNRKYQKLHPKVTREHNWKQQGINTTVEQFEAMRLLQNDRCILCGQSETRVQNGKIQNLTVDHDHTTGKIRGLLCSRHNRALGLFDDNIETLQKAVLYLKYHKGLL